MTNYFKWFTLCIFLSIVATIYTYPTRYYGSLFYSHYDINTNVDAQLIDIISEIPTSARVRIGLLNTYISMFDTQPIYEIKMEYSKTRPGFTIFPLKNSTPLSQWTTVFPMIKNNKCNFMKSSEIPNLQTKTRALRNNVDAVLMCPMITKSNQILGFSVVSWDTISPVSSKEDIIKDTNILQEHTQRIVEILQY